MVTDEAYKDAYRRQLDLFNPAEHKDKDIAIIGVGGIGSLVAVELVKNGFNFIKIYDKDKVELHNVSNQFYKHSQIGMSKVEACKQNMMDFAPLPKELTVRAYDRFVDNKDKIQSEVVIFAVDSLEVRRELYKVIGGSHYLVDARFGGVFTQIFCADMSKTDERKDYEKSLNVNAAELPCTGRSVAFSGFAVAGFVGACVCWMLKGVEYPRFLYWDLLNMFGETNKYYFTPVKKVRQ